MAADGSLNVTLTGSGKALGYLAAFGFVLALVSSACTWLMGSDRSQAVAAYDGCGPRWLGTFSAKFGTPINVNFTSGVLSTLVFIFASQLNGDAAKIFAAMIGVVLLFTTMSYILIFPTVIKLRMTHGDTHRPYKIPGGMAGVWFCGVICTAWAGLRVDRRPLPRPRRRPVPERPGPVGRLRALARGLHVDRVRRDRRHVRRRRAVLHRGREDARADDPDHRGERLRRRPKARRRALRRSRPRATDAGVVAWVRSPRGDRPAPTLRRSGDQASIEARTRWMAMRRCCSGIARL